MSIAGRVRQYLWRTVRGPPARQWCPRATHDRVSMGDAAFFPPGCASNPLVVPGDFDRLIEGYRFMGGPLCCMRKLSFSSLPSSCLVSIQGPFLYCCRTGNGKNRITLTTVMHLLLTSPWHCRQTTGPCGAEEDDLLSWEVSYDGSSENSEDDPPTAGNSGR